MSAAAVGLIRLTPRYARRTRHPQNRQPNLSLFYCMGLLARAGVGAVLVDTDAEELAEAGLAARCAGAETVFVSNAPPFLRAEVLSLAARLKAGGCRRVFLLDVPAAAAEAFLPEGGPVDALVVGEYEETVGELSRDPAAPLSGVAGLAYRAGSAVRLTRARAPSTDLDALPFPEPRRVASGAYEMLYPMRAFGPLRWGHLMASRGCPFACSFCAVRVSYGARFRERSVEGVLDELAGLLAAGANAINFVDDVFITRPERAAELCEAILRSGLRFPWLCQTRADHLEPGLARLMRAAGCSTVCVGVEAGTDRLLARLRKGTTVALLERAFAALRAAGLWSVAYLMIGHPEESPGDRAALERLVERLAPTMVQVHFHTPYPNAPEHAELTARRRAEAVDAAHYDPGSRSELARFQKRLYLRRLARPGFWVPYGLRRLPQALADPAGELRRAGEVLGYLLGR